MASIRPASIIQAVRRPSKWDGCIPTHTGQSFDVLDPKTEDVRIEDVVQGLAYKFRYGGQIGPITVAEHSVLVSKVIEVLWPDPKVMMAGLLHDGCEAYTHDIQAPVRKFVRVQMRNGDLISWGDMERRINTAISKALSLGDDFYAYPEVEAADIIAAAIEKLDLPTIVNENWGLPNVPAGIPHLRIQFLPPADAAIAFRMRYDELKAAMSNR